jgi:hypothetical protein
MATANFNSDITVNLYTTAQSVDRTVFGVGAIATEGVEAGFTETYRVYESNTEVQQDSDVGTVGKAAAAAYYAQPQHPKKLIIISADYETVATGELGTSLDAAYADIQEAGEDFYGICVTSRDEYNFAALAAWCATNTKLGFVQSDDSDASGGTPSNDFDTLQALSNKHGISLWHDDDAEYADIAWMAQVLAADPDNRASVAYDKTLTGMTAPVLTSTNKSNILGYGGNLYLPFLGVDVTRPGKASEGSWIDEVILQDWIKARVQEDLAQYLIDQSQLGRKVPYTQMGLNELGAQVGGRFQRGVQIGHFEKDSVVVTVPDIDDVSAATKASRAATIEASATITGGIATVTVNIGITT